MAKADRILVVGGGIAGLSAAIALRRQGYAPELAERAPGWPAAGAGIALYANGVRVLGELGVGEQVCAAAARLRRWEFRDERDRPLCATDLDELWADAGPSVGIERVALQDALLTGAAGLPARLGTGVTALTEDGERVSVTFSDGSSGRYDLVVGADGIYSTVRAQLISQAPPRYAGLVAWRAVAGTRPDGVTGVTILVGEGSFAGLVPVGGSRTYGFAAVSGERFDDPAAGRLARLRDRFGGFGGPVPAFLAALEHDGQLHSGPIEWVELDRWHTGRVVLIGDAAHASTPHLGEGGSMALEDALVLAAELRAADTVEQALPAFAARRRPRVRWVQEQSRAAAGAWVLPPPVRDAALRERGDQMLRDRYRPLIAPP
ncbi:MAG TPA: FAD-dependent monooxygenase [Streptosporangiaceae bacterium]|jgi:2-polyprenyl-6-methoxyphenol hydroxylase-like FAD-dependent oxidoreductase